MESILGAMDLLAWMQQLTPGSSAIPATRGLGTEVSPWMPNTPQEWWWAARQVSKGGGGRLWFKLGGRLVSVNPQDRYSLDHGRAGEQNARRFGDQQGPTYPAIYAKMAQDLDGLGSGVKNKAVAQQVRALLGGAQSLDIANSAAIPVMTAAFFLSECSRNYTAFHTGLMVLDLVEAEVKFGLTTCSWENVLWHPAVLNAQTNLASDYSMTLEERKHLIAKVKDFQSDQDAFGSLVSRDKMGGIHPMAHQDSVAQSSKDLAGRFDTSFTMVRQHEANVLIKWLATRINKFDAAYEAGPQSGAMEKRDSRKFEEMMAYKSTVASSAIQAGQAGVKLGSAIQKKMGAFLKDAQEAAIARATIVPAISARVSSFDCLL